MVSVINQEYVIELSLQYWRAVRRDAIFDHDDTLFCYVKDAIHDIQYRKFLTLDELVEFFNRNYSMWLDSDGYLEFDDDSIVSRE